MSSQNLLLCVCVWGIESRRLRFVLLLISWHCVEFSYQQRTNTQIRRTQKNTHTNSFLLSTRKEVMIAASCPNKYIFKLTKEEQAV